MSINIKGSRILVVDDEPKIHALLGRFLTKEGFVVEGAYSADDAIKAIEREKPDLVILDIMMPEVSGIEVCNQIKGNPQWRDIMVLIVSARDAQEDRLAGLSHGADDYVSKPFHLRSLVRKIGHMLQKKTEDDLNVSISPKID